MKVYLDECGYTGEDLFNAEQPIFTIATISLPEHECESLKLTHFSRTRMPELKHKVLARTRPGRKGVLEFVEDLTSRQTVFRAYSVHKRYALLLKSIDLIVERIARDDGLNLYKDGAINAYANMSWICMAAFRGETYRTDFLKSFQGFARAPTADSCRTFFSPLAIGYEIYEDMQDILAPFLAAYARYGAEVARWIPSRALDLSLTTALPLMIEWRRECGEAEPVELIHDRSSNMSKQANVWQFLTSNDRKPYDDGRARYPVSLDSTAFEDSKAWAGLQLTDVLAGAITSALQWAIAGRDPKDTYGRDLMTALERIDSSRILLMVPSSAVTPDDLGMRGVDVNRSLEYLIGEIVASKNR